MRGSVRLIASPIVSILFGPPRPLRVVASYARATYLTDDHVWLSLVVPGALLPPDGLQLSSGLDLSACLPAGAAVRIGRGRLEIPGSGTFVVSESTRFWIPVLRWTTAPLLPGVRLASELVAALRSRLPSGDPLLRLVLPRLLAAHREAVHALRAHRLDRATTHALAIAGLGPGLTPLGDDVLAGTLLALHLLAHDRAATVRSGWARQLAEAAAARTTARSAAWLRQAARGEFAREYLVFAATLCQGNAPRARTLFERVLRIGSTSGWGVAYGLLATLDVLASETPAP